MARKIPIRIVPAARNPLVRSYLELRSAVGWIALGLPWILLLSSLMLPDWVLPGRHSLPISISAYYYTPMRNVLVGSLCAIGFFNLCARGYEWRDELAGFVSAASALGLAFCPTFPPGPNTPLQRALGNLHNYFAELFFTTLAVMCLALFRTTAANRPTTRNKRRRNTVYTVCGLVMLACGVFDFFFHRMRPIPQFGPLGSIFCCEMVALQAFGVAWLVKGKTFLANKPRPGSPNHRAPHLRPPHAAPEPRQTTSV